MQAYASLSARLRNARMGSLPPSIPSRCLPENTSARTRHTLKMLEPNATQRTLLLLLVLLADLLVLATAIAVRLLTLGPLNHVADPASDTLAGLAILAEYRFAVLDLDIRRLKVHFGHGLVLIAEAEGWYR